MIERMCALLCFFAFSNSFAENCIQDISQDRSNGNVQEVKDFYDLDNDGVKEKIAFVSGEPTSGFRYSAIYSKSSSGCYKQIYGGTENVSLGTIPGPFLYGSVSTRDIFNGFKVIEDSESNGYVTIHIFSAKSNSYAQAYTINESQWVRE